MSRAHSTSQSSQVPAIRNRSRPNRLSPREPLRKSAPPDAAISLSALDRSYEALQVVLTLHPHADAADRRTLSRAQNLGLIVGPSALARYHASRFTQFTATAYPNCSAAVLQIANDWHSLPSCVSDPAAYGKVTP